jgi:hypothetical protein
MIRYRASERKYVCPRMVYIRMQCEKIRVDKKKLGNASCATIDRVSSFFVLTTFYLFHGLFNNAIAQAA